MALAKQLLSNCIEKKAHNVQLIGTGSFVTIDFGEELTLVEIKTNQGIRSFYRGAWHLWIQMAMWRIDKAGIPIIGSEDTQAKMTTELKIVEDKKLINVSINNRAFDLTLYFEDEIIFSVFSFGVLEDEQWILFTPDDKVFVPGPGSRWSYRSDT